MQRIEVNVSTGQRRVLDLTPDEVADAQARTAAEQAIDLDALDTASLNAVLMQPGSIDRAELKTLFNHENRIRALEGKAAITQAQFVAAIKPSLRN